MGEQAFVVNGHSGQTPGETQKPAGVGSESRIYFIYRSLFNISQQQRQLKVAH